MGEEGSREKRRGKYRAAACAERKEPVVLMSSLLFHSEGVISIACVQPTTPAKQHSMSTLPSSETVRSTADSNCSALVTSTLTDRTVAPGKSFLSASISRDDFEWSRSKSARPERPCSSKARAFTRARVPAPPVTVVPEMYIVSCGRRVGWQGIKGIGTVPSRHVSTYRWRCPRPRNV